MTLKLQMVNKNGKKIIRNISEYFKKVIYSFFYEIKILIVLINIEMFVFSKISQIFTELLFIQRNIRKKSQTGNTKKERESETSELDRWNKILLHELQVTQTMR